VLAKAKNSARKDRFERRPPKGKDEDLGISTPPLHPQSASSRTRIFGAKASLQVSSPCVKMSRSKAYLFVGVDIRWRCDPDLLKGTRGRFRLRTFHFAGGLKGTSRGPFTEPHSVAVGTLSPANPGPQRCHWL